MVGSHWSLNILGLWHNPEVMDNFCNTMIDIMKYYEEWGYVPDGRERC